MRKKKLIVIIGKSRAGKSTIVRALTGCGGQRIYRPGRIGRVFNQLRVYLMEDIRPNRRIRRLYAIPDSLQENHKATILDLRVFLRFVLGDQFSQGIVMALQPTYRINGRVSLERISNLEELRSFAIHPFILRPGRPISNQQNNDVNNNELPRLLQRLHPIALDARAFAYFNAEIVQNRTRIIR